MLIARLPMEDEIRSIFVHPEPPIARNLRSKYRCDAGDVRVRLCPRLSPSGGASRGRGVLHACAPPQSPRIQAPFVRLDGREPYAHDGFARIPDDTGRQLAY